MASTHVVYESTTGRIVGVHHFLGDAPEPDSTLEVYANTAGREAGRDAPLAVASIDEQEVDRTRGYRVDVDRNALIVDDHGFSFGFGGHVAPGVST
ncbi:MAG: hypothetical protein ACXWEI_08600 [Mycobacterium sp.]